MEKITSLTGTTNLINLSDKYDLHQGLNNNYFAKITPETIALITLANANPAEKDSLILLSTNAESQLVKKRPREMLGELDQRGLHTQAEKEKIIMAYFAKGYRSPAICGQALFVPFDGPRKNETDWYNILLIEQILPWYDKVKGVIDTLLIFKGGQGIILPRRPRAVITKAKDCLHRGHFYFKLYDLILTADQLPVSPSLPLIEYKLRELSLDIYPLPSEEVLNEGLRRFKKLGQKWIHYLEVAEDDWRY